MRKLYSLLSISLIVLFVASSCSDKDIIPIETKPKEEAIEIDLVSQFVYDGLSAYYLWSNEMINKKPTANDSDPKRYFESVLYKTDTDNGWSWITDDADGLIGENAGEPKSFGYSLDFKQIDNKIYAFVEYAFPNTPASNAGLQRLDLIGEVNGETIKTEIGTNYISQRDIDILYGDNAANFTIYKFTDKGIVFDKKIQIVPTTIKKDPVLFEKIYTIRDKKIGYLFYTSFISNYNDRLFEVFSRFKNEGVTDLVLDLRYNLGGEIYAASYLASLFTPKTSVEQNNILTTLSYNKFLNSYYDEKKQSRSYKLGVYQEKDEYYKNGILKYKAAPNPLDANLNLNKIYIIATKSSASASELILFCSQPIMGKSNVIHIGDTTSGKYTASFTVHPFDNEIGNTTYTERELSTEKKNTLKNWAMQPIVAIYKDSKGKDFVNPGYLKPDYQLEEGHGYIDYWKPLGDTEDVFLGQALYLITGNIIYKPIKPVSTRTGRDHLKVIELSNRTVKEKPLIIDNMNLTTEDFKEITRIRNSDN